MGDAPLTSRDFVPPDISGSNPLAGFSELAAAAVHLLERLLRPTGTSSSALNSDNCHYSRAPSAHAWGSTMAPNIGQTGDCR